MRSTLLTIGTLALVLQPLAASAATMTPEQAIKIVTDTYAGIGSEVSAIILNPELTQDRKYTAISNILKTKHDTVKNSIGNIR